MKHILTKTNLKQIATPIFLAFVLNSLTAQTPTNGDFRTVASGFWSDNTIWQERTGGNWVNATVPPTSTNNVYIQNGHTVTLNANAECNDLHINTAGGVVIATNILSVNGKIRAYTGAAVTTTGEDGAFYSGQTSTSSSAPTSMLNSTGTGALKFVGLTRNITNTGEFSAGSTTSIDMNFALLPGEIGTLQTAIKARSFVISSGSYTITGDFRPDGASFGTGTFVL
jgi:hypothetical protein